MSVLPLTLALAAPASWQVDWTDRARPEITDKQMRRLIFCILRELLSGADLVELYNMIDGRPQRRSPRPHSCKLSARKGNARSLRKPRKKRRGRPLVRTKDNEAEFRLLRKLNQFEVADWLKGTRLKFQSGRWCVAPPKISREELGRLQTRLTDLRAKARRRPRAEARLEQRIEHAKRSVFTAVSRLLCFDKSGHPKASAEFEYMDTSEVLAVHHACTGSRQARARCLNVRHITWGLDADNAYHRVMHGALIDKTDVRQQSYRLPARKRRPTDWIPPSQKVGFVRESKRLRERGSRKLYFDC